MNSDDRNKPEGNFSGDQSSNVKVCDSSQPEPEPHCSNSSESLALDMEGCSTSTQYGSFSGNVVGSEISKGAHLHPSRKVRDLLKDDLFDEANDAISVLQEVVEGMHNKIQELQVSRNYNLNDKRRKISSDMDGVMHMEGMLNIAKENPVEAKETNKLREKISVLEDNLRFAKQKSMELITQCEDMTEKYVKTNEDVSLLQTTNAPTIPDSGATNYDIENPTGIMKSRNSPDNNGRVEERSESSVPVRTADLENEVKALKTTDDKLRDMNIQWQLYIKERDKKLKSLQDQPSKQMLRSNAGSSHSEDQRSTQSSVLLNFSSSQQIYVDELYQRIRREADDYHNRYDALTVESRQTIAKEKRKQEEAMQKLSEQTITIDALNAEINLQTSQVEELRTALIVATRSPPPQASLEENETVINLRETVRQYGNVIKKLKTDNGSLRQENRSLKRQIRQDEEPSVVEQTLVNQSDDDRTATQQNDESAVVTQSDSDWDDSFQDANTGIDSV